MLVLLAEECKPMELVPRLGKLVDALTEVELALLELLFLLADPE